MGYGFFWTANQGCGQTADGTGYNVNEAQVGSAHCALDCSGVRDADWDKHADHTPDTPQNFVCPKCSSGTGPCGRQVHCAAAPVRQAAWDLVARDLRGYQGSPFNYDANTAFIIGNKLFYQGSGNVGTWHACSCTNNTSDGCGASNGYMQWLAADDDNGNLNDGTPHMTAIYAAFNRHNIACSTPTPQNSGCSTGPTGAPSLTATPGDNQVGLSWTSVANAAKYWVFRTEGHAGCNFGKTLIGTVTSTSFTDTEVANGRPYCYVVMAVGSSNACFGPASTCTCVTPSPGSCTAPSAPTLVSPANGATGVSTTPTLDWSDVTGATSYDVQVCSDSACATVVRSQTGLTASQWTVSPALNSATTYYWRARAVNSCGASAWSATWSFTTASGGACTPTGATYDATLKAPKCGASNICGCDTGSLIDSRDNIAGKAELNQPNTINNSCADGTSGTYHNDESVDRIVVQTTDGTALGPGKQVRIDATVWCWGTSDYVDIYYTSNANSPTWTAVATGLQCNVSGQAKTFSVTMTLANVSGLHAVRVQERYGGSASACTSGSYNDRDDLIFQVGTTAACTPTGATYDATLKAPKCGASNICGCDTGSLIDSRDNIAGKAELNQPNTINNSCADGTSGTYHNDESVDRIVVQTTDGTALGPGKQVRIDATVWCWGTSDYVDIYYTSNANSPTWTAVATGLQCNVSGQAKTFSVTMTLANVSGLHAVRVQERYGGSASACTSGSYNDRDDLAFQVP
ncbi:hypothetical protein HRbin11_00769 [bacterium HR11]|nr:hypothetical protein HRbin11_00769 [bacterium HR11]